MFEPQILELEPLFTAKPLSPKLHTDVQFRVLCPQRSLQGVATKVAGFAQEGLLRVGQPQASFVLLRVGFPNDSYRV